MPTRLVLLTLAALLLPSGPAHAAATPARPDLTVSSVTDPPSPAQPGSAFSVTARLRNTGRVKAPLSRIAFSLSTDRSSSADDVLLATGTRVVKARRSILVTARVKVPANLPARSWSLLVCADDRQEVRESSETNNCRAAKLALPVAEPQQVFVPAPAPPAPAPDTTAPGAPDLSGTLPVGVGADETPLVLGRAEAGSRVRFFRSGTCGGSAVAATTADADGSVAAGVPVAKDAVSQITATATDAAGNVSACSKAVSYEQDATDPEAPVIASTTPASPSPTIKPTFAGTAEPSTIVTAYLGVACNGTFVAQTVADVNGAWQLDLTLPANDTTSVTATATDPAGHTSRCSTARSYRHDDTPPAAAAISGVTPVSPGSNPTPTLSGTAEAGADVLVYVGAGCSGSPLLTTAANGNGAWTTPVAAAPNASRSWSARARDAAGNQAVNCSNTTTYVHDDIAPVVPAFNSPATNPVSPSPDASPIFSGTADPGAIVRLYPTSGCTGGQFFSTIADGNGDWELELLIDEAGQNQAYTFSIRSRDTAGNQSACAVGEASYVHDNVAPSISGVSWSASPGSSTTVTVTGTTEPNRTVYVFGGNPTLCTNPGLALASGTADGSGAFTVNVVLKGTPVFLPPDDGEYPLGVASRDAAGNISACPKTTYVLDRQADAPSITNPVSPGGDALPFVGGGAEAGAEVRVYETGDCTGTPFATLTADGDGGWGAQAVTPVVGTVSYSAEQTDVAGNTSSCASTSYERDVTPPTVPVLTDTFPASGGTSPYIRGTADDGSFLTFYASDHCEPGTEIGSGQGGAPFSYPGAQVFLGVTGPVDITATAQDATGNVSGCSNVLTFTAS